MEHFPLLSQISYSYFVDFMDTPVQLLLSTKTPGPAVVERFGASVCPRAPFSRHSSLTRPTAPHLVPPPPTAENLDYAELPIIDISQLKTATDEERLKLAVEVRDAMHVHGFFYVVNHGWSPEQTARIFDIADIPFSAVSAEEKQVYAGRMKEVGSYQGYKLRQYWHIDNGVHDQLEHYNINRDITKRGHPEAVRPFLPEIEAFARHSHFDVLHPVLRLLALGLELAEEELVDMHGFDAVGETYVRFMKYYPRSQEEEMKTNNVWLKGHSDFGTITVLYSQPVAALQVLGPDNKWRWVRHIDNAIVINAGDALEFLSGGFYKATIHRVVQPPKDQQALTRIGAFYFGMTDDAVKLAPLSHSPVLQRVGFVRKVADKLAPTMEEWRKGRTSAYGQSELKASALGKTVEEEVINGVVVKHYS
ncbi:Clavaminate synthase-like protein [Mycena indigotica]|uniref:Clavaminate synthase-like protein n=1 Tax=Mycena indigotica TaxID=2126181 RepID=A0A8H6SC88_9AGAR|nr:Clavaminate synthase-like protein [Mycena indigotica]KAF7296788.1 Clavaminate synthase-like protein [Mycena indigotica]